MLKNINYIDSYTTGSQMGYIPAKTRGVQTKLKPIPEDTSTLKGNFKKAMLQFKSLGATHYTIAKYQGVPDKGYSNRYYYMIYYGYII